MSYYFEYSSMTRLSLIVEGRSTRAGTDFSVPLRPLASTSSHSGMPRLPVASAADLMLSCSFARATRVCFVAYKNPALTADRHIGHFDELRPLLLP